MYCRFQCDWKSVPRRLAVLCLLSLFALPLHAAERVVLRTGMVLVCDHRSNVNGRVRLYFTPSDSSFTDVDPQDILRTEPAPASVLKSHLTSSGTAATKTPASRTTPAAVGLPVLLDRVGSRHHIDPDFLASVVQEESGGHARAISHAGARGLMQLMPGTAAELGVRNSLQPEQNVAGGTTYLDALLMYYNDNVPLALAAYNAGPAAVNRYGGIPPYPATRRYVARVIHDFNRRKLREARQKSASAQVRIQAVRRPANMQSR